MSKRTQDPETFADHIVNTVRAQTVDKYQVADNSVTEL